MKFQPLLTVLLLSSGLHLALNARAEEARPEKPNSWGYVRGGPVDVRSKPSSRKPGFARLGHGALVPAMKLESEAGAGWTQVRLVDPATLDLKVGWVPSDQLEILPANRFPDDAELLKQAGGVYLDDFAASHTRIIRFLIAQASTQPVLACYLAVPALGSAQLVVMLPAQGKFVPGASVQFALSETQAGIIAAEVRDLLGDGIECLVTREPFRQGPETYGVNMVIRRIEADVVKTLWEAPVEFRRLDAYPPRPQILQPPEKNIGAAGTVTAGEVDFRLRGGVYEPVWKGKVELYAVGREKPVDSVAVEKLCPWDGTQFAPLK
jgi:hypothetical protein